MPAGEGRGRLDELGRQGSQFVIATHSPRILAYPHARIDACTESGTEEVDQGSAEPVRLMQAFLTSSERFLARPFSE